MRSSFGGASATRAWGAPARDGKVVRRAAWRWPSRVMAADSATRSRVPSTCSSTVMWYSDESGSSWFRNQKRSWAKDRLDSALRSRASRRRKSSRCAAERGSLAKDVVLEGVFFRQQARDLFLAEGFDLGQQLGFGFAL